MLACCHAASRLRQIGSIRREYLGHLVILGEVHLHRIKQAAREAACMVGFVPNCQPTWATRLWSSAWAAVVGCAGN
jgi:hypothetical protein